MTAAATPLSTAFVEALGRSPGPVEVLEPLLTSLFVRARTRWPDVSVDPLEFARFVAGRVQAEASLPAALEATATDELYLTLACVRRDRVAIEAFDRTYLREVGAFVSHLDRSPAFADEVRQTLREKLFASESPRIAEYTGSGALGGWLRVAALRIALNLKRSEARVQSADAHSEPPMLEADLGPELSYLRSHYREAFADALRTSVAALSDRERTLLRLYHVDHLSLEAIAALYRVHLSTVSRWLSRAREQVSEATTQTLCKRLGVGSSSVHSIAALVLSQVDLSLSRLLGTRG